jgi:hypothetical protein
VGYLIFGLGLKLDGPLGELNIAPTSRNIDVRVFSTNRRPLHFDSLEWRPTYRSADFDSNGAPVLVIHSDSTATWLRMRYSDGTEFVLDRTGSEVHLFWVPPSTPEDVLTYLLGPVLGLLLYLRGLTCLHASAIACDGAALVFVGPAEAGKSTLAAAYARQGYRVLTDDVLVLVRNEHSIVAIPGVPRGRSRLGRSATSILTDMACFRIYRCRLARYICSPNANSMWHLTSSR